jgi:hypothetical protein
LAGKPYDPDPLGEWVRRGLIIDDETADCMMSMDTDEALDAALEKRLIHRGRVEKGRRLNYEGRLCDYLSAMPFIGAKVGRFKSETP